jgi:hypothetical protein
VLPVRTAHRAAAPDPDDALLYPVAVTYRTADGALTPPPRTLDDVLAIRGLVIEVRLLPVDPTAPAA